MTLLDNKMFFLEWCFDNNQTLEELIKKSRETKFTLKNEQTQIDVFVDQQYFPLSLFEISNQQQDVLNKIKLTDTIE